MIGQSARQSIPQPGSNKHLVVVQSNVESAGKLKGTSYIDKLKGRGGDGNEDKSLPKKLLQSFLMNKYKEIEYTKLRKDYDDEAKSYEELLIEEIKKEQIDKLGFFGRKRSVNSKHDDEEKGENIRDIKKIEFLMKQLKGFVRFMKFNGLDDDHLRIAAHYLKHAFFPKGSYIFKQGEQSRVFYGIIKGKVSLRIRKHIPVTNQENKEEGSGTISPSHHFMVNSHKELNFRKLNSQMSFFKLNQQIGKVKLETKLSIKPNRTLHDDLRDVNHDPEKEEEIFKVSDGMCFGEWALIYDIPRTASAYAIEDTELFYLDKGCFDLAFHKGISRADADKKNFLIKRIPALKLAGKVHDILKKIIPIFCDNKRIIYTELDAAEFVYLIYQGECKLQKLYIDKEPKSKDEIYSNKEKLTSVMILEKGGLAGLELVSGCTNYKYNLVCNRDQTIVYKISLKVLRECNSDILEYLTPIYQEQEKQMKKFYENYETFSHRLKISYKPKITHIEKMSPKEKKKNEEETAKQISELVDKARKVKIIPKNDLKVKMDVVHREKGYYEKLKKQRQRRGGKETLKNLSLLSRKNSSVGLMENYVRNFLSSKGLEDLNMKDATAGNPFNLLPNTSDRNTPNLFISPIKRSSGSRNSFYLTQRRESIFNTGKTVETANTVEVAESIPLLTDNTTKVTLSVRDNNRQRSIGKKYSQTNDKIKINENEELSYKIEKYKPSLTFKFNTSLKKAQDIRISKNISSTLSMWSSTMNESAWKFNSGKFNLPLVSVQINRHSQIL